MNGASFQQYSASMPKPKRSLVSSGKASVVEVSPSACVSRDSAPPCASRSSIARAPTRCGTGSVLWKTADSRRFPRRVDRMSSAPPTPRTVDRTVASSAVRNVRTNDAVTALSRSIPVYAEVLQCHPGRNGR